MTKPREGSRQTLLLGVVVTAIAFSHPAMGQPAAALRFFQNPPALGQASPAKPLAAVPSVNMLTAPVAPRLHSGVERVYDLSIRYTDGVLYDPTTQSDQKVHLRSYVATGSNPLPTAPYIAPLIDATPGDTVRITLRNALPADPSCVHTETPVDTPHCFNGTNLHSHGLWVSPSGNSDNVLLSINPGMAFQYEYNIPEDHPAGTFWYHPHRHGSTALQVGSGMVGALIIHGDRKPTPTVNGDLDTLLTAPGEPTRSLQDRTLVFEQIQYACVGADGKLKMNDKGEINWSCAPNEVGVVESYAQFGPGTWQASKRWTSINGIVLPTFKDVIAGTPERWRLIHAGVRDTIKIQFRKALPGSALARLQASATHDDLAQQLNDACSGEIVPYQVVAADGLTMDRTMTTQAATLQPGYRYDALALFPEKGTYCIVQPSANANATPSQVNSPATLLGFVNVTGERQIKTADVTKALVNELVALAKSYMPAEIRDEIIKDLETVENGAPVPHLSRFVPHPTVTPAEVAQTRQQELVFFIGTATGKTEFAVGNSFAVSTTTGSPRPAGASEYDPNRIDRQLTLGQAQQWELRSYSVSHPFHIHVNPFQIISVIPVDSDGRDLPDVSVPGMVEADKDDQYAGLKGAWKDTIWVKTNLNPGDLTQNPVNYYRITVRTRYERYIGEFVLHCHILEHEDQGMMQNVQIGLADGSGGMAHAHH